MQLLLISLQNLSPHEFQKTGFSMIEIIAIIPFQDDRFGQIFDYPYQQSPIFPYKKFQNRRLNLRKLSQKLWTTEF